MVLDLDLSPRGQQIKKKLLKFTDEVYLPGMKVYEKQYAELEKKYNSPWVIPPMLEDMKKKAKAEGLWNLFLPKEYPEGAGLTNVEYSHLAELMGRYSHLSEVCNCMAPDTGNMEVFAKYGTLEQKEKWLKPLLNGDIRSVFFMTEPMVASSDATNIETTIIRKGDHYVVNGRKWWSSGVHDPRSTIGILMGKSSPDHKSKHRQQSMIVVTLDMPGIKVLRHLNVFGYNDAPHGHGEVVFENVKVPLDHMILGEGRGFEVAQGRLGPGRIHHCMRAIGVAELALECMVERAKQRTAFGKKLQEYGVVQERIAEARINIEMMRLLCLKAAAMIDKFGDAKGARLEIAMVKVAVPSLTLKIIDDAIQVHGGGGVSQDFPLAKWYSGIRAMRMFDGPDEVHKQTIAVLELKSRQLKQEHPTWFVPDPEEDLRPPALRSQGILNKSKL